MKLNAVTRRHFPRCGTMLVLPCLESVARAEGIPKTAAELWGGFAELDRTTPVRPKSSRRGSRTAWSAGGPLPGRHLQGTPARVAAFYAFPKGGTKLPALLSMHGGGQSAGLDSVVTDAQHGYASISINWGGNKLNFGRTRMTYNGPQTDWGRLDATHPPQRNPVNHFAGAYARRLYAGHGRIAAEQQLVPVLIAARRALTFLEQQPEVDPARIGVYGHSMGGKLTTDLAGIDQRVKAAVPSCGGAGDLVDEPGQPAARQLAQPTALELACISDNAYIPRITCPVLWLSPTNDFHAHIDAMAWNWRNMPDDRLRFSISPHLNHRHTDEHAITQYLWFEEHLKGAFKMPRTPQLVLDLKTANGVPLVTVTPDDSSRSSGWTFTMRSTRTT